MYCKTCGNWNSDEVKFCAYCGDLMDRSGETPTEPQPGPGRPEDLCVDPDLSRVHRREKIEKALKIAAVALAAAALIAGIILFVVSRTGVCGYYAAESGKYSISVNDDGSVWWYQNRIRFEGYYEKDGSTLKIYMSGESGYRNTFFIATRKGRDYVVNGGIVNGELFVKQEKPSDIRAMDD